MFGVFVSRVVWHSRRLLSIPPRTMPVHASLRQHLVQGAVRNPASHRREQRPRNHLPLVRDLGQGRRARDLRAVQVPADGADDVHRHAGLTPVSRAPPPSAMIGHGQASYSRSKVKSTSGLVETRRTRLSSCSHAAQ